MHAGKWLILDELNYIYGLLMERYFTCVKNK